MVKECHRGAPVQPALKEDARRPGRSWALAPPRGGSASSRARGAKGNLTKPPVDEHRPRWWPLATTATGTQVALNFPKLLCSTLQ
jgi:hypothetical protein